MSAKPTDEAVAEAFGMIKTQTLEPAPPRLSLAQAIYGHLRVNEAKQPFQYVGNPVTIRAAKGKAFGK